jgi:hypothetical protein
MHEKKKKEASYRKCVEYAEANFLEMKQFGFSDSPNINLIPSGYG